MNEDDLTLMLIKGMMSALSPEDQGKVEECAIKIRELVHKYDAIGLCALNLVGAEEACNDNLPSVGGLQ